MTVLGKREREQNTMSVNPLPKAGWVKKNARGNRMLKMMTWNNRWFVLKKGRITYYTKEQGLDDADTTTLKVNQLHHITTQNHEPSKIVHNCKTPL
jgi:hypothetical protein